jgi:hypothetical protein
VNDEHHTRKIRVLFQLSKAEKFTVPFIKMDRPVAGMAKAVWRWDSTMNSRRMKSSPLLWVSMMNHDPATELLGLRTTYRITGILENSGPVR